jgi:hypothetical protein
MIWLSHFVIARRRDDDEAISCFEGEIACLQQAGFAIARNDVFLSKLIQTTL